VSNDLRCKTDIVEDIDPETLITKVRSGGGLTRPCVGNHLPRDFAVDRRRT
jgi:hypothetical protein